MKYRYETPEMEIIKFEAEDIITTSTEPGAGNGEGDLDLGN